MATVVWPLFCAWRFSWEEALVLVTQNHHLEEIWLEKEAHLAQAATTKGPWQHLQDSDKKVETLAYRLVKPKGKSVPHSSFMGGAWEATLGKWPRFLPR